VGRKVAGNTNNVGVLQSGHFWRQMAEAIAYCPDRAFCRLLGTISFAELVRVPSAPPDNPVRKPRPCWGFRLVIFPRQLEIYLNTADGEFGAEAVPAGHAASRLPACRPEAARWPQRFPIRSAAMPDSRAQPFAGSASGAAVSICCGWLRAEFVG